MKYYAVKKGLNPGIYETWEECKKQVIGYEFAEYKSFSSKNDAIAYLNDEIDINKSTNPIAYIDGSYNPKNGDYSFGAVLLINGEEIRFSKKFDADEYSVHRNVAGEIKGAGFIIQYAINHNIKELDLYYDYEGIHSWFVGIWSANKPISLKYVSFAQEVRNKIKINFYKVKSHTNVYYNEIVDKLAKDAVGIK